MMNSVFPTLFVAALVLCGWILSGAIHELGHAIVGKMAGLDIVDIRLFGRVHLRSSGKTTALWYAAISISGMLFTVMVGLGGALAVLLLRRKWPYIWYAVWFFVPMMSQFLVWFCVSLLISCGIKIPDDDIRKFMQQTEWPPLAVSLIGLIPIVLCVAVLTWVWN